MPATGTLTLTHLAPIKRHGGYAVAAAALLLATFWLSLGVQGSTWQWPDLNDPLVVGLRVPRSLAAMLVGATLAAAGAALQALFRNPLAEPSLIGTSSGAGLAAVAVMALGLTGVGLPLAAFLGGLAATGLLLVLVRLVGAGEIGLLLLGIMLGSFTAAITGLLMFMSDDLALRAAMTWLAGHLGNSIGAPLGAAYATAAVGIGLLCLLGRELDCMLLGDEDARALGVHVGRVRLLTAIGASLAVGAAVSIGGIVPFVGMMVPNACALVLQGSRRQLIVVSAVAGAMLILLLDTLARSVVYPLDLPVGLLAGLAGPVFFLWLLRRRARGDA